LEDLGVKTYLQTISADNADALFDAAIGQLLKLQAIPCPSDLPAYNEELLARNCTCSMRGFSAANWD
jgi:aminoglycoside/choline kinase family phosphotransferase